MYKDKKNTKQIVKSYLKTGFIIQYLDYKSKYEGRNKKWEQASLEDCKLSFVQKPIECNFFLLTGTDYFVWDIDYYNSKRPHQRITQRIPLGYKSQSNGQVLSIPILGGLCNHYIRQAA